MQPSTRRTLAMLTGTALLLLCAGAAPRSGPVTARAEFRPTFEIKPLVHRYEAFPGRTVDFSFDVRGQGKATRLKIEPVSMVQAETGHVAPDPESPEAQVIRMLTPQTITLQPGGEQKIRGRLTVPNTGSSFQTYGLLVTDLGPASQAPADRPAEPRTTIGINFVTQYLLRIEVATRGATGLGLNQIKLEAGELIDVAGKPAAQIYVENPTQTQFEFELRGRLLREDGTAAMAPFKLAMPVRANADPVHRFTSRILGGTRLRMFHELPEAIMPGRYQLLAELYADGRPRVKASFPITVYEGQFPAQQALIAQVAAGVQVAPAQLELSLQRRGNRILPLTVRNTSRHPVEVQIQAADSAGQTPRWLVIRPDRFTLPAGGSRNVITALRNSEGYEAHQYAHLRLAVHTPGDAPGAVRGAAELPVAFLTRQETAPSLQLGAMKIDSAGSPATVLVPVTNVGAVHVPLNGALRLTDGFGRVMEARAGFDRWLLPGDAQTLRFQLPDQLPAGEYQLTAEVRHGQQPPLTLQHTLRLEPAQAALSP